MTETTHKAVVIAQVEIAIPGYPAMSGTIDYIQGEEPPTLDQVAIQLHSLTNDLVLSIRKNKPTVDGVER